MSKHRARRGLAGLLLAIASAVAPVMIGASQSAGAEQIPPSPRPLVLAHYYIWFDPTSWQRAKSDFPALGSYSSDERSVIKQHVTWAKAAGIDGFLVSWKHTPKLDRRLQALADEAQKQGLRLGITYQGLDFARDPLPIARVQADLEYFEETFAHQAPFTLFGKPLVVWSGTWDFSTDEIRSVTSALRPRMLILASEKNEVGYSRVAPEVDGNAYYWSSVNPGGSAPAEKLNAMGALVHRTGGLWIAPVAPGYDGTLLGGTRVINRDGAGTLEAQWNISMRSSPDAIGVISWNEFSENTHIEPSEKYGRTALDTLARLAGARGPTGEIDSSSPDGRSASPFGIAAIVFLVALLGGSLLLIRRRSHAVLNDS